MRLNPSHWNLRSKLALSITLLLAAIAGFLFVFFPARMESFSRRWIERRAVGMVTVLANAAAPGLDLDDDVDIKELLTALDGTGDARYATVWRANGTLMATWKDGASKTSVAVLHPVVAYGPGGLRVDAPIHGRGGASGTISVGFSLEELAEEKREQGLIVAAVAGIIFLFGIAGSFALGTVLMRPVQRVTEVALRIAHSSDTSAAGLPLDRSDEVGQMASAIAHMLKRLEEKQEQLAAAAKLALDASRRAGMADVATSVLHNVGNVLNSVNVSSSVVINLFRNSKTRGLAKVAQLFAEHPDDLVTFLTEDPRGKKIPAYLTALAEAVADERARTGEELVSMTENINHIKAIITSQQSHARAGGMVGPVSLSLMLEEALKLNFASYEKHGVEIVRDFADLPDVEVDRHKLFQIVVNLLANARHALKDGTDTAKRMTLRTRRLPDGMIAIEVRDNGSGIPPENMEMILRHGFTTKPHGHGFGLHSAACAAAELKGSITVHSDGVGRGAVFTVIIPEAQAAQPLLKSA